MPRKKGQKIAKANHTHEPTAETAAGTGMPWPQHLLDNTLFVDGSLQSLGRRDSSGEGGAEGEGVEVDAEEEQAEPAAAIGRNKKGFNEVKATETTQTSLFSAGPGKWWGRSGN